MLLFTAVLIFVSSVYAQVNTTLLVDIATALLSATDCAACLGTVLPPLQALAFLGDQPWVDTMSELCILGGVRLIPSNLTDTSHLNEL